MAKRISIPTMEEVCGDYPKKMNPLLFNEIKEANIATEHVEIVNKIDEVNFKRRTENYNTKDASISEKTINNQPSFFPGTSNSIIVNTRQNGNPVLKCIRNIAWEFGVIVPDFVFNSSSCALFLSLRYHLLHKEYIYQRVRELAKQYKLRVLLCLVDVKQHSPALDDLSKLAALSGLTLILAFSFEEAGRYLETYKSYENKSAEFLMEQTKDSQIGRLADFLTNVKSINKTDIVTLLSVFGTLKNIVNASSEELARCPGFGDQKVRRLLEAFNEPFRLAKEGSPKSSSS
jgi:DNA excision repair protein ERCC-1